MRVLTLIMLVTLTGCMMPPYVPVPIPPTPIPVPSNFVERATIESIKVGDPASVVDALPAPDRQTTVGDITIRSWVLNEARPDGGYVRYEIQTRGGVVVTSIDW